MYAIFETGGKQYKVAVGDVIRIEKIQGNEGDKVSFENVIAFSDESGALRTGTPYLDAATVNAVVTGAGKGEKVIIFKFKAKKDYRKKQGHRQPYTEIEIENFTVGGKNFGVKSAKPTPEKKEADVKAEAEAVKPEAEEKPAKAENKAKEEKAEEKSAAKMTKADITAKLDELGVEYVKSAKKEELLALLTEAESK